MEERWSWASARLVGLVGTGVVVVRWLQLHGAVDATTYALLHLYLAGLMAPEIVRLVRGKVLGPERAFAIPWAVAALEFMLVVLACGRAGPDPAMMTTALLAGLGWTALACGLGAAGRGWAAASSVRGGLLFGVAAVLASAFHSCGVAEQQRINALSAVQCTHSLSRDQFLLTVGLATLSELLERIAPRMFGGPDLSLQGARKSPSQSAAACAITGLF